MTIEPKILDFECTSDECKVTVRGCGVKVEIGADGKVTVYSPSKAGQPTPTIATVSSAEVPKVGALMPDGTIYAGVSPGTGEPMYTTPADAPLTCTFNEAGNYASSLDLHGHKDWRVPTRAELNVLFGNRAAIGGFDATGSYPAGWYWSSSRYNGLAWAQRFSDGYQYDDGRSNASALRCVRIGKTMRTQTPKAPAAVEHGSILPSHALRRLITLFRAVKRSSGVRPVASFGIRPAGSMHPPSRPPAGGPAVLRR